MVLLPFEIHIDSQAELGTFSFVDGDYRVTVYPPYQAIASIADARGVPKVPVLTIIESLQPRDPLIPSASLVLDDHLTIEANALQIDFWKEDFDRRQGDAANPDSGDPPPRTAFRIANQLLDAIRATTGAAHIRPIGATNNYWWLHYQSDDGQDLAPQAGLRRGRAASHFSLQNCVILSPVWEQVCRLVPSYSPEPWATLLLDAEATLPAVGPTVVLAAAALENLIESKLDFLAAQFQIPSAIWDWINTRREMDKNPEVEEQFSSLLQAVTGRSLLKEKPALWTAFKNLKTARNRYLHSGRATIGNDEVDERKARELLGLAKEVAAWLEEMLPTDQRRPPLLAYPIKFVFPIGQTAPRQEDA